MMIIAYGIFTISIFLASLVVVLEENGTITLPNIVGTAMAGYMLIGFVVWFAWGFGLVHGH